MTPPMISRSTLRPAAVLGAAYHRQRAGSRSSPIHVVTARVQATGTLWLAGMPDGATDSGGDVAPDNLPLLVA